MAREVLKADACAEKGDEHGAGPRPAAVGGSVKVLAYASEWDRVGWRSCSTNINGSGGRVMLCEEATSPCEHVAPSR